LGDLDDGAAALDGGVGLPPRFNLAVDLLLL
jgi:hypothetical protein